MKVILNNKKYKIKTSSNLTVKEYIEMSKFEQINIANYISVVTGLRVLDIAMSSLPLRKTRRLVKYIGKLQTFRQLEKESKKVTMIYFDNETIKKEYISYDTLGTRILYEQKAKELYSSESSENEKMLQLIIYSLAVVLSKNYDASKTNEVYSKLLKCSYLDIFPFAIFFFRKLTNGQNKGRKLLKTLRKAISLIFRSK